MSDFELSPLGRVIWEDRYGLKDDQGNLIEKNITDTFHRVAKAIASKEKNPKEWAKKFYWMMSKGYFCPAGRILAHSGTSYSQLLNCFVLPFRDDSLEEIMHTATDMAITQKFAGGTGFNYSALRPEGSYIKGVNGRSCGVIGFLSMMSTISEVIEQGGCLTGDSLINTKDGLIYLGEIVKDNEQGWYDHELTVKTKDGDCLSEQYYVNGYSDIYVITSENGLVLKGTPKHKLYVFTSEGYSFKEFKNVKKGDWIVSILGQHEGNTQKLNMNVERGHHNCIVPDKLPLEINEDFAFFLGYFLVNGFSTKKEHDYRIGITIPDNSYLIHKVDGMFKDLFGENISLLSTKKDHDESTTYYISNKMIKEFFSINGLLKSKSIDCSIPRKIRCSPPHILGCFLTGLFEADGALSHDYPSYTTSSIKLAHELQIILHGLGIPSNLSPMKRGIGSFSKNSMYRIRVESYIGLENWNKITNPNKLSRFIKCQKHFPDINRGKNHILPNARYWLTEVVKYLEKFKYKRDNNFSYLLKRIKRYVRGDRNLTLSSYNKLRENEYIKNILPDLNNFLFSQIKSISLAKDYTSDLNVNKSHTYIANSIITHNSRRGANLGLLDITHPDVWDYISYKREHNWQKLLEFVDVKDEDAWSSFTFENMYKWQMYNVSVSVNDDFFEALKNDDNWKFKWNDVEWKLHKVVYKKSLGNDKFKEMSFDILADCEKTAIWKVKRRVPYPTSKDIFTVESVRDVKASELWHKICYNAWADGCPGLFNMSSVRKMHNLEYTHPIEASNPCAEQPLPAHGCCLLSSLVLPSFIEDNKINYNTLKDVIHTAIRFMDNVIDNCDFPLKEMEDMEKSERRIGLGTMGVHDMLIALRKDYDSEEGRLTVEEILKFIRNESYRASIEIAKEKKSFPVFDKGKYIEGGFVKTLPESIIKDIYKYGIRNSCILSQAPTGTIGSMYNVSTGCEPWFALSFDRNTRLGSYEDGCPAYLEWKKTNTGQEQKPSYFKTSQDISPENHVRMMMVFNKYMDSSVSKTINLPNEATVEDVKNVFLMAMKNGIKGVTIFRDGSKQGVLIKKKEEKAIEPVNRQNEQEDLDEVTIKDTRMTPKTRGNRTTGATTRVHMDKHNMYITANKDTEGDLVEIFATIGESKEPDPQHTSGVEDSWAEALGKIISLALRAGVKPSSIIRNLKNIPSDKPVFSVVGDNDSAELISSPPHAIGRIMEEELKYKQNILIKTEEFNMIGGYCENCGSNQIIPKGPNCYRCLSCGYETCGGRR